MCVIVWLIFTPFKSQIIIRIEYKGKSFVKTYQQEFVRFDHKRFAYNL